ncbi:MAG: hypothetical protein Ct9H90mP16_08310 [Candidatus Poseidoniales archaeon]|nr:MAG: hypothetical protein Ct9H90mP16_08310 [Candidatus Poseidoniales archaeon]
MLERVAKDVQGFPGAEPDEWMVLDHYHDLLDRAEELRSKNVIIIPHGSLVEYLGPDNFIALEVPNFGNRQILKWEGSRELQRQWLESGGCTMPKVIENPKEIDGPVIVKYAGPKGVGATSSLETSVTSAERRFGGGIYHSGIVLGTRYYFQFFFDPLLKMGIRSREWAVERGPKWVAL